MFCPNCGHEVSDEFAFCAKCGTRLRHAETAEPKQRVRVAADEEAATRRVDADDSAASRNGRSVADQGIYMDQADDRDERPAYRPKRAEIYSRENYGSAARAKESASTRSASRSAYAAPQLAFATAAAGAGASGAGTPAGGSVVSKVLGASAKTPSAVSSMNVSEGVAALSEKASNSLSAISTLSVNALASRGCAILAAVSLFMPWLNIPAIATANGFGSMLGLSNVAGDSSFTLLGLANMCFKSEPGVGIIFYAIIIGIAALLIGGIVSTIQKGRYQSILTAGCSLAAVGAVAWLVLFAIVNTQMASESYNLLVDVFEMPAWVYVTGISAVAATVFGCKERALS